MRRIVLAMIMATVVQGAHAADLPDLPVLRGSLREGLAPTRWQGFYVGGQYGASSTRFNDPGAATGLSNFVYTSTLFSDTVPSTIQGFDKTTANGAGGFIGYNWQWDDAVLGIDANYNVGGQRTSSFIVPSVTTQTANGNTYDILATGSSSMKITDYGSIRGRAGWAAGPFMPYLTLGVAVGRADFARNVTVESTPTSPTAYGPRNITQTNNGAFIYGYSYGGGIDVHLIKGLFARGEVEVTRFVETWGMDATVTTARGGLGYKF